MDENEVRRLGREAGQAFAAARDKITWARVLAWLLGGFIAGLGLVAAGLLQGAT